jgi:hypothetical protein
MKVNLEAEEISPQRRREHEVLLKHDENQAFGPPHVGRNGGMGGWKGGRMEE